MKTIYAKTLNHVDIGLGGWVLRGGTSIPTIFDVFTLGVVGCEGVCNKESIAS